MDRAVAWYAVPGRVTRAIGAVTATLVAGLIVIDAYRSVMAEPVADPASVEQIAPRLGTPDRPTAADGPNPTEPVVEPTLRPETGDQRRRFQVDRRPVSPGTVPRQGPDGPPPARADQPMRFHLVEQDGRPAITAFGVIGEGTADALARFDTETAGVAEILILDSAGGLIAEALEMGRFVRERGLDTQVRAEGLCASSCPLVLAGGVARLAHDTAWIGVHSAYVPFDTPGGAWAGVLGGQRIAGDCLAFLAEMGVSLDAWIPALTTDWREMYFFTPEELTETALVTELSTG